MAKSFWTFSGFASAAFIVAAAGLAEETAFTLRISKGPPLEISWPSQSGFSYTLESATNLSQPVWETVAANLAGNNSILEVKVQPISGVRRFYRASRTPSGGGTTISPNAVDPVPGLVYPEQTTFGSAPLGLQYTIPRAWKGGLREGTATLLFGSDTEPGLVLGFITLAGDAPFVAQTLSQDFETSDGYYQLTAPAVLNGNIVTAEWQLFGQGIALRIRGIVHPSGGVIGFAGLFTEPNRGVMERVLNDFANSTVTAPRQTRADLIALISGKSFSWAKSSNTGNGGTSGSLSRWSQNNAFFCPGTFEVTTQSESSYSGNLSGGGFYSGGSSSSSTEAGDWTIIDTPSGPAMVLLSSSGVQTALITLAGNVVYFGDQEFAYQGPHACP